HDPWQCGIPTHGSDRSRGFGQPEGIMIQNLQAILPIENGAVLSLVPAFSSHSQMIVSRKQGIQILKLLVSDFLRSYQICLKKGDALGYTFFAVVPDS